MHLIRQFAVRMIAMVVLTIVCAVAAALWEYLDGSAHWLRVRGFLQRQRQRYLGRAKPVIWATNKRGSTRRVEPLWFRVLFRACQVIASLFGVAFFATMELVAWETPHPVGACVAVAICALILVVWGMAIVAQYHAVEDAAQPPHLPQRMTELDWPE